ncbi:MAG: acetyl-CoA carboxylase biotin carboxyl carrier protein [Tractidigestivibacter sp.]|uniref:acetyl-CoA carboxylase biotin carboxyl carrier protein n=1 Tax=Tractidigestivibacter sp. TaxID=2847320 RepID=UPI002A83881F|nr:acetyl-CoA carboxylase biotin carboxyl carrier protein [Tractidigestivibacter sp.]MDY4534022.1 acetyl-CoA carboxylase biotin carboxyl carrier protein [Tractidigestivibacter sp.]
MDTSSSRVDALARVMQERGLARIRIEEGDSSIEMERPEAFPAPMAAPAPAAPVAQALPAQAPAAPAEGAAGRAAQPAGADDAATDADAGKPLDMTRVIAVRAPMVGVFYAAASPGAEPFVRVGSKVQKGDTLCVIEAMKAMNEVTAETDGEVVDICVSDGELVEYDCVLMKIY